MTDTGNTGRLWPVRGLIITNMVKFVKQKDHELLSLSENCANNIRKSFCLSLEETVTCGFSVRKVSTQFEQLLQKKKKGPPTWVEPNRDRPTDGKYDHCVETFPVK